MSVSATAFPASTQWRLFFALIGIELLLLALHFFVWFEWVLPSRLHSWLDLGTERSFGTWFSSGQLLMVGLGVLLLALVARGPEWPSPAFLTLAALGFVFLSADEALSFHERITNFAREHVEWVPLFPGGHGAWISVYAVLGALLIALTWAQIRLMWSAHRPQSLLIALGFATLVTGAVLVEVAGYIDLIRSEPLQIGVEEFLEMLGASVILLGVTGLLMKAVRLVRLTPGVPRG